MVSTGVLPLPPEGPAGTEYHIYYLANSLAKLGVEVHLITELRGNISDFHQNIHIHDFKKIVHPPLHSFVGWLLAHSLGGIHSFAKYLEVVRSIKPDLIHTHGRLAARLISIFKTSTYKLIYTLHDQSPFTGVFTGFERLIRILAYLAQEYRTVRKADHIIAVSKQVYSEIVEWMKIPRTKVSYIPNGVDTNYFRPAKEKKRYVLFVGRLTRRKGVDVLLKAFSKIAPHYPEVKLIIVGDGEEKERLVNMVNRLSLKNRVVFLSNVPRKVLREIYARSMIFVLPSRGEGLPLSLLEAMASGCAVISTKVSGVADVIKHGETGMLIEPDNVVQLEESLISLLEDQRLLRKLATNARKAVIEEYSWDAIARKTVAVYERVLG